MKGTLTAMNSADPYSELKIILVCYHKPYNKLFSWNKAAKKLHDLIVNI